MSDRTLIETAQLHFVDLNKLAITFRLGNYRGEFLYWGFYSPAYWRNYWHVHSFFEVCYIYQGRGCFRIHDELLPVATGQLFVAKPDEPHEIISSTDDPLGIYFWAYTLLPTANSQHPTTTPTPTAEADRDLNHLFQAYIQQSAPVSHQVDAIPATLEQLTVEVANRQLGYRTQIQSLALTLLIATARALIAHPLASVPLIGSGSAVVDTMVRYLQDNYDRPLQVRDVAAQLHMSERHTSRLFQQAMGQSIQQYLIKLRLTVAKQRLLDPALSVSEIATSLGYHDVRHFSTLFRQHTGITPTRFRTNKGTHFADHPARAQ